MDLAYHVVGDIIGWPKKLTDRTFSTSKPTRMALPNRNPVHLVYPTAFEDVNGVEFLPDCYGRDRKFLRRALRQTVRLTVSMAISVSFAGV
jgi:murein L,D-transpeptidase YcbB/YkuD